jgi:hypothetical protein
MLKGRMPFEVTNTDAMRTWQTLGQEDFTARCWAARDKLRLME